MQKLLLFGCLLLVSCVTVRYIEIKPVESEGAAAPLTVESPVKAHLVDGSTVMFPKGVIVDDQKVRGQGFQYDLTLENSQPVTELKLDDVAAMESYQDVVNTGATVAASTVATVGGGMATIAIVKAVFGSCPTTYSLDGDEPVLEAESFSYSIAPGFEARDVDRLGIVSGDRTAVELEIRNEALETHYVNHIELLEVRHAADEAVYPDAKGKPIIVGQFNTPDYVADRNGQRMDEVFAEADGNAWSTATERLRNVSTGDMDDYIDLEFDVSPGSPTALVLRLRNSLLNTVLLYDVMLKGQGFAALDWMGDDLDRLWPKYQLAKWYRENMGMRIAVWDRGRYRDVASFGDTGPIAWHEVAIPLPATNEQKVKVRLSFVADNWRIDHAVLATNVRAAKTLRIPLAEVHSGTGAEHAQAKDYLGAVDDTYLVTRPGEYLRLKFDVGNAPDGRTRTWFLAAEGYYIEWMRKEWLDTASAKAFVPNEESLLAAIGLWEPRRDDMREQFEATRIRVR